MKKMTGSLSITAAAEEISTDAAVLSELEGIFLVEKMFSSGFGNSLVDTDRKAWAHWFVCLPTLLRTGLPFPNVSYGLFTRWLREIKTLRAFAMSGQGVARPANNCAFHWWLIYYDFIPHFFHRSAALTHVCAAFRKAVMLPKRCFQFLETVIFKVRATWSAPVYVRVSVCVTCYSDFPGSLSEPLHPSSVSVGSISCVIHQLISVESGSSAPRSRWARPATIRQGWRKIASNWPWRVASPTRVCAPWRTCWRNARGQSPIV